MAALRFLTVGRTRRGPLLELEEDYLGRITRFAAPRRESVPASRERRAEDRRRDEGRALAGALGAAGTVVALDAGGALLDSAGFRERLVRWRARGEVCFVVGGPDGLDPDLAGRATEQLSLGRMTLPHELALVVLLEQVYRALCAEENHPYGRH